MATNQDLKEHADVLDMALALYKNRDEVHQGLWKGDTPHELAGQALHKAKRVDHHCRDGGENPKQALDEALDLINYSVFIIRQMGFLP